jgi:hypothetical protein
MVIGHTTSGAEGLAAKAPGAQVVSAFSTVPSEVLFPVFERRERDHRRTWFTAETTKEQRGSRSPHPRYRFQPGGPGCVIHGPLYRTVLAAGCATCSDVFQTARGNSFASWVRKNASQFNHKYSRFFGQPTRRNVRSLRVVVVALTRPAR